MRVLGPATLTSMSSRFNFRQKPTGVFKWFLKSPALLFRGKLGFLFGERFLMINHVGRKSGTTFHTPLEVVAHDTDTAEYFVCSGTGPNADWYRNITAQPVSSIQVKNRIWTPDQRFLEPIEAADRFADYERRHAKAASKLLDSMGQSYDGTEIDRVRMMRNIPMIAFSESVRGG